MNRTIFSMSIIFILLLMLILPVSAEYLEVRGRIANETGTDYLNLSTGSVKWVPRNFAGLFYDLDYGLGSEELTINQIGLKGTSRTINKGNLVYATSGDDKPLNVVTYAFAGNYLQAKAKGLKGFDAGQMTLRAGQYKVVGWQAGKYVALHNKTNKFVKFVIDQKTEARLMNAGNSWDVGKGWKLKVLSINTASNPKKVNIDLYKDNVKVAANIPINEKWIYTYTKTLSNETGTPLFVTYVANITAIPTPTVRFRYTWAIDTVVKEVKPGNKFGLFNTTIGSSKRIVLRNLNPIVLTKGSRVNLMDNMNFKIADKSILRFYPNVEYPSCIVN